MTKDQTYRHFIELINQRSKSQDVVPDDLLKGNLQYLIDRYYNTSKWERMKVDMEQLIIKGDIVGLGFYIFNGIRNFRSALQ